VLLQQSIDYVSVVYTCNTYFCNAMIHIIYSGVSGQWSHTIHVLRYTCYLYRIWDWSI